MQADARRHGEVQAVDLVAVGDDDAVSEVLQFLGQTGGFITEHERKGRLRLLPLIGQLFGIAQAE